MLFFCFGLTIISLFRMSKNLLSRCSRLFVSNNRNKIIPINHSRIVSRSCYRLTAYYHCMISLLLLFIFVPQVGQYLKPLGNTVLHFLHFMLLLSLDKSPCFHRGFKMLWVYYNSICSDFIKKKFLIRINAGEQISAPGKFKSSEQRIIYLIAVCF